MCDVSLFQRVSRLAKEYENKIDEIIHRIHNEVSNCDAISLSSVLVFILFLFDNGHVCLCVCQELNISGLVPSSLACPLPPPGALLFPPIEAPLVAAPLSAPSRSNASGSSAW